MRDAAARLLPLVVLAVLLAAGAVLPTWAVFLLVQAFSKGLVALGLVAMVRGGRVSFGQGLVYCAGAYTAALLMVYVGIDDAVLLTIAGGLVATVVGLAVGPLLASYRGIFFGILTLALSMIVYGIFNKLSVLGGSDGLNLHLPRYLGWQPTDTTSAAYALFAFVSLITVIAATSCRRYFDSLAGLVTLAVRDNEIRIEAVGASASAVSYANFVLAAALGGIGGALSAFALGHVDPDFAFWTTSGEFLFVAILAGTASVSAIFVASILLEFVRSYSSQYFPNSWQMALGIFLLLVILFLPEGLGALAVRRTVRTQAAPAPEPQ